MSARLNDDWPEDVPITVGNAAWAYITGAHVPEAIKQQMRDENAAMVARSLKKCRHRWVLSWRVLAPMSREERKRMREFYKMQQSISTQACMKCGHIRVREGHAPPAWVGEVDARRR